MKKVRRIRGRSRKRIIKKSYAWFLIIATVIIIVALFLFANATKQERNTAAIEAASSIQEENIENYNNEYFMQNME